MEKRKEDLTIFREKNILDYSSADDEKIKVLFDYFNASLSGYNSKTEKLTRSPVSVAKALHHIAPNFFPLWDIRIAKAWGCSYQGKNPESKYINLWDI